MENERTLKAFASASGAGEVFTSAGRSRRFVISGRVLTPESLAEKVCTLCGKRVKSPLTGAFVLKRSAEKAEKAEKDLPGWLFVFGLFGRGSVWRGFPGDHRGTAGLDPAGDECAVAG